MVNLNEQEEKILKYWKDNNINEKVREKNREGKKFYFLDGPPFVSGDLHPGQMWVKSNKDIILRYKRMRGFNVYDRSGYDVHGLPIENKVEAKLQITSKKDIEKIGLEEFTKQCKEFVSSYMGRMDRDYERFGMSLDFSHPYNPADNSYMEGAWAMLKRIYDKGYIYSGKRSLLYCPHCETVVAQGSLEVEYQDDTDTSVYVLFKIDSKASNPKGTEVIDGDTYLLAWTTTPWTLPSNMAIAANPKVLYVKARFGDKNVILAKDRFQAIVDALDQSAIVESEFYGNELEGVRYRSPLEEEIPMQRDFAKFHRVIFSEEIVSTSEGTGLVHIAPGHGLEDYTIGLANKIPIFSPVSMQAQYTGEAGLFEGLKVPEEANAKVLDALKSKGAVMATAPITHSYPHCWRCHNKVIQLATEQWFINIQKVKKKLLSENDKVSWYPKDARRWQDDVLSNSPDWCISRQRYWGIPIPLWKCGVCGSLAAIGSLAELKEVAVDRHAVEELHDLHRPFIDRVKTKCQKCGAESERVKDVLDVWFDSSVAFRVSLTGDEFKRYFPVDYIAEAVEQLRGWFSYMLKTSVLVYGKKPFNNVFTHRMMMDANGRPMHKSLGNFIPLGDIIKASSADSFRLHCLAHMPELDFPLSIDNVRETSKTIILMYNISNLLREYSQAVEYMPEHIKLPSMVGMQIEDAWIVSRMNTVMKEVTKCLDNYEMYNAVSIIKDFITMDFSRFYLKIAKKKVLLKRRSEARKTIDVINYVLSNITLLLAPMIPFTAEALFLDHYRAAGESVFLQQWPKPKHRLINDAIERDMAIAQNAITALLSSREKNGISLRWPVASATLEVTDDSMYSSLQRLSTIIEDYANAKHLELKRVAGAKKEARPVFAKIGPDFKDKAKYVAEAIKNADAEAMTESVARTGKYALDTERGPVEITQDHFITMERVEEQDAVLFKYGKAYIDTNITRELKVEAQLREFEHEVQLIRKELKLNKKDRIELGYVAVGAFSEVIKANAKKAQKDLNARLSNRLEEGALLRDLDIGDETVKVSVRALPRG